MRFVTNWIREFVDIAADDRQLAHDLSMAGIGIEALGVADNGEPVFEADITTNRPDAMNHYGVAREASVIYDVELKPHRATVKESAAPATGSASIEILDPDLCGRYSARVIRGVKIGPSPGWMVRRLEAAGLRSINNVADVTNYLLLELGHPMHAFDLDTLAGRRIVVRRARAGEKMATLDGVERDFASDNLVIADAEKPVAIAGVMGGLETEITERTTNVLLESAWFEPRSIRKTSKQFGMHTDASHRFERGADLNVTALAADRAAQLIQEVAGGEVCQGVIDVFPAPCQRPSLVLRAGELLRILGEPVPSAEVDRILRGLGFRVAADGANQWLVEPPGFRLDVEREIDVIEEVGRLYGYEQFPNRLPAWAGTAHRAPHFEADRALRQTARALGYSEAMTYSLVAPSDTLEFAPADPVRLANPLSEEASVLRTSMAPGLLAAVEHNLNRGTLSVRLFELGKTYGAEDGRFLETPVLALAASGDVAPASVHEPSRALGFFDLKGDVEVLLDLFEHKQVYFDSAPGLDYYHPGRVARAAMDGETVARFGEIHPRITAARKLRQRVLLAEIFIDRLYRRGLRSPAYEPLSRVPAVGRDFSLLVPERLAFASVAEAVRGLGISEVVDIRPVEVFRGGQVPAGKYSLLLRVVFQRPERTLSDTEVNAWSRTIAERLERELGAVLRT